MERIRRLIAWIAPPRGPLELLKQSIRDLEDQVPKLNDGLFMIKAQVTSVEKDLARLRATEGELVEKVRAADTESKAVCYSETLTEVRRELARDERRLAEVSAVFALAQQAKRDFLDRKEARIHAAKEALAAQRDLEWRRKFAQTHRGLQGLLDRLTPRPPA